MELIDLREGLESSAVFGINRFLCRLEVSGVS